MSFFFLKETETKKNASCANCRKRKKALVYLKNQLRVVMFDL